MSKHTLGLDLVWRIAAVEAARGQHEFIAPEHLFMGLCRLAELDASAALRELALEASKIALVQAESEALRKLYAQFDLDPTALRREIRQRKGTGALKPADREERTIRRSPQSRQVFARAGELAHEAGAPATAAYHLLAALLDDPKEAVAAWLGESRVDVAALREAALAIPYPCEGSEPSQGYTILGRYGKDLVQLARRGEVHAAIGRRGEMLQVVRTLSRATKNNPLLSASSGRTRRWRR